MTLASHIDLNMILCVTPADYYISPKIHPQRIHRLLLKKNMYHHQSIGERYSASL